MNSDDSGSENDNSLGIKLTEEEKKTAAGRRKMKPLFLYALWKVSGGSPLCFVNMFELGADLGLDEQETHTIVGRLVDDMHVQHRTIGGGISITNYGAEHVEEHAEDFEEIVRSTRAAHLMMEVKVDRSINISGGQIGAVNQGDHAQVNVTQNVQQNAIADLAARLRAQIEKESGLDAPTKKEAIEQVETIEEEAKQPQLRSGRIKAAAAYLSGLVSDAKTMIVASAEIHGLIQEIGKLLG